jgi:hypothetical protein
VSRIFELVVEKPVPTIVTDTVELTVPLTGDTEVTVAAVDALCTVNPLASIALPVSRLRTTTLYVPGVFAESGSEHVIDDGGVVTGPVQAMSASPVPFRVTVAPDAKPVPVITTPFSRLLLYPVFGEILLTDGAEIGTMVRVTGNVSVSFSVTVTLDE